ncbi:Hypothetical protein CINCED_3A017303 [Cinara cedri]|uniref:Uncharacterized protein n=1 Tax=Cinara cedri TaxID=506608 RepID=A0A5E4LZV5_9HEMI|nr:Hypothetical protein CINCED_3A017303 [Cinara cedri]
MSNNTKTCVCGKVRGNLNLTNWQRHIDNCKARKTVKSSRSIASFFTISKKNQLEEEKLAFSCSNVEPPDFNINIEKCDIMINVNEQHQSNYNESDTFAIEWEDVVGQEIS